MENISRVYDSVIENHFYREGYRQMLFLSGARQTGKTTCGKKAAAVVFNWDNLDDREVILGGPKRVMEHIPLRSGDGKKPIVLFDEIHKFKYWKDFLKGFFDSYAERVGILVTGSARLDIFSKAGDSMMGRYFQYHVHPLGVGELLSSKIPESETRPPVRIDDESWQKLVQVGGFPEPYARGTAAFSRIWRKSRRFQLLQEDLRDLSKIHDIAQLEMLATFLERRAGNEIVYTSLAREIRVSENTVREWVSVLNGLYFGFSLTPWSRNLENSLKKTPKWYPRDWSGIEDPGRRNETILANHLLKSVDIWNDLGFGDYSLHYFRDKQKREVDFVVVKDDQPWLLVECKTGDKNLSPSLAYLQKATGAPLALQVSMDAPYRDEDCFSAVEPACVSGRTFLSQLP